MLIDEMWIRPHSYSGSSTQKERSPMRSKSSHEPEHVPFHFLIPSDDAVTMIERPAHTREHEFIVRAHLNLTPTQERKLRRGDKSARVYHGIVSTERFEHIDPFTAHIFLRHRGSCTLLYPNGTARRITREFGKINEYPVSPLDSIEIRLEAARKFLAECRDPGKQAHHLRGLIVLIKLQEDPELAHHIISFFSELDDVRMHLASRVHDTAMYVAERHRVPHTRITMRTRSNERKPTPHHLVREATQRAS